jgi:hypothetical protein
LFQKDIAATGGMKVMGLTEDIVGVEWNGLYTNDDTGKTTAALGALVFGGAKKSGTSIGAMGANANIAVFRNNTTTRFILDADGDSHEDVGTAWTNFDDFDDPGLLASLAMHVSRGDDPVKQEFRNFLEYNKDALERARLVTFDRTGAGHHFVNMSKLTMLHTGAIRQLARRLQVCETALVSAGISPPQLYGGKDEQGRTESRG